MRNWIDTINRRLFDTPDTPESVHIEVTPPAPDPENEPDESMTEEELAALLSEAKEQYGEIKTRLDECLQKLAQLSNSETPQLTAIQSEIVSLRSELAEVKSSMVSMQNLLTQRESTPEPIQEPVSVEPSAELLISEPEPVEPQQAEPTTPPKSERRRARFI